MMVCPERYGEIRLLGSAAFGFAAFGGGALMSIVNPNLTYLASFGAASAFQVLSMPLISRLDFSMLHAKSHAKSNGKEDGTDAGPKLSELLKTCTSPKMLFVVVVTFLCGWESALIDVFFNVHLNNIGAPVSSASPKENDPVHSRVRYDIGSVFPHPSYSHNRSNMLLTCTHTGRANGYGPATDLFGTSSDPMMRLAHIAQL